MISVRVIIFFLLPVIAFGQGQWMEPIRDFSEGIMPGVSPSNLPPNALIEGENFVIRNGQLELRKGYGNWTTIDTLDTGVRGLYEFYNNITEETQILAVIGSEVYHLADDSTVFYRIGISNGDDLLTISDNDSIVYGSGTNWLTSILPEDGDDWILYVYGESGTFSFPVYRVLSDNHLKLDAPNTKGLFAAVSNFALVPTFSTTNNLQFETWNQICFISDGVHPVRKWTGATMDNSHYLIDSAVVATCTYNLFSGTGMIQMSFSTPFTNAAPSGDISEYQSSKYSIVYIRDQEYPFDGQKAIMHLPICLALDLNGVSVYGDYIDQTAILTGQKIYVALPLTQAYSFGEDTVYTGIADSIIQYDTITPPPSAGDSALTQFGVDTLEIDEDSVTITLSKAYSGVDDYVVVHSYATDYKSRIMQRKVSATEFRLIRPSNDNNAQQILNWVAIGTPNDWVDADSAWLWQWDFDEAGDQEDFNYTYVTVDDYRVIHTHHHQMPIWRPRDVANESSSQFSYNSGNAGEKFRWISVGEPNTFGERNSDDDSLCLRWGIDTLPQWTQEIVVYFDDLPKFPSNVQVACCTMDSTFGGFADTIETEVLGNVRNAESVKFSRRRWDTDQIVSWIAIGSYRLEEPDDTNSLTLVYDQDVFVNDTIRNENMFGGSYLFKIIDGPSIGISWWANGRPCTFHVTEQGSLVVRVCIPSTIDLPVPDSSKYVILKLQQYPPAKYTKTQTQRLYFVATEDFPRTIWLSDLYDHDVVSTANFQEIGGDSKEKITGLGGMFGQRWIYMLHGIYSQTGNHPSELVTNRRQNVGLWSDGFLLPYQNMELGINKENLFVFDGTSAVPFSKTVTPFFEDSINAEQFELVRGYVMNDKLLFSYPAGSSEKNDRTLWCDLNNQKWMTSTLVGASYLVRTAPDSYDSVLIGDPDSAKLYIRGGTTDAGNEIVGTVKTKYFDFGAPEMRKTLEKVLFNVMLDSNASLFVSVYQDTLTIATWTDTLTSIVPGSYWQEMVLTLPDLPEFKRVAVGVKSDQADTLRIDYINFKVNMKGEGIGQ